MSDDRCRNCRGPLDGNDDFHTFDQPTRRYLCAWAEERTNA